MMVSAAARDVSLLSLLCGRGHYTELDPRQPCLEDAWFVVFVSMQGKECEAEALDFVESGQVRFEILYIRRFWYECFLQHET